MVKLLNLVNESIKLLYFHQKSSATKQKRKSKIKWHFAMHLLDHNSNTKFSTRFDYFSFLGILLPSPTFGTTVYLIGRELAHRARAADARGIS